jgi:hypothetical protein
MAITCRLREYKAEEENRYEHLLRYAALGSAVLIAAGALFVATCFASGGGQKAVAVEKFHGPAIQAARIVGGIKSANWRSLPEGRRPSQREPGVQDLSAPEWEYRTGYKDLKAMAVFEVRDASRSAEESRRMAAMLQEGGRS